MIKVNGTEWNSFLFHSRTELRWAIFFTECEADWEYRPGTFEVGNRVAYAPDFRIKNVRFKSGTETGVIIPEFFVNVHTEDHLKASCGFTVLEGMPRNERHPYFYHSITVRKFPEKDKPYLIDESDCPIILGVDKRGRFTIFGDEFGDSRWRYMNKPRTMEALNSAWYHEGMIKEWQ